MSDIFSIAAPIIGGIAGNALFPGVGGIVGAGLGGAIAGTGKPPTLGPANSGDIQSLINQLPNQGQIHVPEIHVPSVGEFFAPLSIRSPSFQFAGEGGDFTFGRIGEDPRDLFDQRIGGFFGNIDELRGRFKPGFSEVREARANEVLAARQRASSNLTERLSNRRIQGSSFARAEQTQLESEFAKVGAEQQAQSFLEEVAINTQILQVERQGFDAVLQRAQSDLQEFQAALQAAGLSAQVGTARSLAEVGASTQEAALSVQAQGAQIESVLNIMSQLNTLSAANAQIQQDYLGGIGQLIGTGLGISALGGFVNQGSLGGDISGLIINNPDLFGFGAGAGTSIVPNQPVVTPGSLSNPFRNPDSFGNPFRGF